MTATECFNGSIQVVLQQHPELAQIDLNYRVIATGTGGGDWYVQLKDPLVCRPYGAEEVACTFEMLAADVPEWLTGTKASFQMFLDKRLRVTGPSVKDAQKLRRVLSLLTP